jgi:hypothetical protein
MVPARVAVSEGIGAAGCSGPLPRFCPAAVSGAGGAARLAQAAGAALLFAAPVFAALAFVPLVLRRPDVASLAATAMAVPGGPRLASAAAGTVTARVSAAGCTGRPATAVAG